MDIIDPNIDPKEALKLKRMMCFNQERTDTVNY